MKKVKIAQIGTNGYSHGNNIWNSLRKQSDLFEIVGYALPENEREQIPNRTKDFDDYREMMVEEILNDPEIEAVAIETEEIHLTKYAIMAARAGKHIHMEKPGGVDLAQFEELIDLVRAKNLTFTIGYMYRFNPKIREAIEKIKNGDIGEVYSVEAHMNCNNPVEIRNWLAHFPGGMMFYLGCHLVDLIYQIQGEPEEVIPFNCSTGYEGVTANDFGMVVFKYPNGVSFAKTCTIENGGYLRRQLVICGTKGTIEIKPLETSVGGGLIYTAMKENYLENWHDAGIFTQSEHFDRYDDMMKNFAEIVRKEKANLYSYDYELSLYRLIQKACGICN